ncbi:restriction endonuclease subunit S [Aurantiacibacter odishensis]|uniref:restriction endonuclease subunit S n=1 Tax=Aurantiacibacter odishensis TaxID=1155476 RepID=UPI000E75307D|nr:restriction endonuclease subunit S [Aurantiacibacter odishensis]
MTFPAYPEYADSGFQWLGKVPKSWSSIPFGMMFRRIKRTGHGEEELLSVYRDYGVIRKSDRDDNFNNASDDLSSYQLVEPGDLAMNKMKAWQGSLGVSDLRGIVSPAYFVFSPRKQFHPPFMHYLLRSPPYAAGYMTISKGIRINQWDVDPDHLTSLPVLFPSSAEQEAIAGFLDRETVKIDALVAEQEQLIALLKEKRQAVISHAVTKGLDPDAPMKDSGIEWLGEIPAHWTLPAVWMLFRMGRGRVLSHDDIAGNPGPYPVYSSQTENDGVMGHIGSFDFDGDFLTWTTDGARAGTVFRRSGRFNCTNVCGTLEPQKDIDLDFCQAALSQATRYFVRQDINPKLMNNVVSGIRVQVPPLAEQKAILSHVREVTGGYIEVIRAAEQAIDLLKERRSALISAAVTGKIDVRGLAEQHEVEAA